MLRSTASGSTHSKVHNVKYSTDCNMKRTDDNLASLPRYSVRLELKLQPTSRHWEGEAGVRLPTIPVAGAVPTAWEG